MPTTRRTSGPTDLQRVVDEAARLTGADGAIVYLLDKRSRVLRWKRDAGISSGLARDRVRAIRLPVGIGLVGGAAASGRIQATSDYMADERFTHGEVADALVRDLQIRSMMAAPLIAEGRPLGSLAIYWRRVRAFDRSAERLLGTLSEHAAASLANERLIAELRASQRESAKRVQAQRALAEIAADISAMHDPTGILQRAVDEAAQLTQADGARIDMMTAGDGALLWAYGHSPMDGPIGGRGDDPVRADEGVSGKAVMQQRVVRTGDYLRDRSFVHADAPDRYIEERGIRSAMAAPLLAEGGAIGTITVHSKRRHAFDSDDAELLGALATQAAIAVTDASLYARLKQSERRYRHLIETSPDIVWSVDDEGRFTYMSDSWTQLTERSPADAIGAHWSDYTHPSSVPIAQRGWQQMNAYPQAGHRMRIEILAQDGTAIPVEINMIATMVDAAFAGAHGAIRDVRDRERLERDLRRQSTELAGASERDRLARELHDSVTQALFSMTMTTRSVEMLLDRDISAARSRLSELRELQRDALAEMRALIFELRPGNLERDGLVEALRGHAAAVGGRTGLAVQLDLPEGDRLPIEVEHGLFRIAQEALHNAVKHASADRVQVSLRRTATQAELVVEDDGVGFDPLATPSDRLGLASMRTRAEQLGGTLSVDGTAGRTRIKVGVPVPAGNGADRREE